MCGPSQIPTGVLDDRAMPLCDHVGQGGTHTQGSEPRLARQGMGLQGTRDPTQNNQDQDRRRHGHSQRQDRHFRAGQGKAQGHPAMRHQPASRQSKTVLGWAALPCPGLSWTELDCHLTTLALFARISTIRTPYSKQILLQSRFSLNSPMLTLTGQHPSSATSPYRKSTCGSGWLTKSSIWRKPRKHDTIRLRKAASRGLRITLPPPLIESGSFRRVRILPGSPKSWTIRPGSNFVFPETWFITNSPVILRRVLP